MSVRKTLAASLDKHAGHDSRRSIPAIISTFSSVQSPTSTRYPCGFGLAQPLHVGVDDHEGLPRRAQFLGQVLSHAAVPAHDDVILELLDSLGHASGSQNAVEFSLGDHLHEAADEINDARTAGHDHEHR